MLSISTGKNQSTEACDALYILTCEYNYKVITKCDTILQEYYITDRRKCENSKRCTSTNNTKGCSRDSRRCRESTRGSKDRTELQLVCPLRRREVCPQQEDPLSVQASRSGHENQRSQNSPASGDAKARWRAEISTCVSINPNHKHCLLYTSPSPRDRQKSRMPSSA